MAEEMYGEETAGRNKLHNESQSTTKQTDIGRNPPKSNGVDGMEDGSRTRV